jgi:hypothetical protein
MPDQHAQPRILFGTNIETEPKALAYNHKCIIAQVLYINTVNTD